MNIVHTTRRDLRRKLDQETITGAELLHGIRQCFFLTQRQFHTKRNNRHTSSEQIMKTCYEIVNDSYRRNRVRKDHVIIPALQLIVDRLTHQFEFSQDAELSSRHNSIVKMLIEKYEMQAQA